MKRIVVFALAIGVAHASCAQAASGDSPADVTLDLGGGAILAPAFEGASKLRLLPIPYVSFDYKDTIFVSVQDGLGVNAINTRGLRAGPVLNVAFPRNRSDDNSALKGMDNIDAGLQAGAFVSYELTEGLSFALAARQMVTGLGIEQNSRAPEGLSAEASVTVSAPPLLGEKLFLSAAPSISFYDKAYMDTYFGVSARESSKSGYKAYDPGGGVAKAGLSIVALYGLTDQISLSGFGQYERLLGDAAQSPLVRGSGGSADQFAAGATISYRFTLK